MLLEILEKKEIVGFQQVVFISTAPDFFNKEEFCVKFVLKVYVGGKRLYGVEIESIIGKFHLE